MLGIPNAPQGARRAPCFPQEEVEISGLSVKTRCLWRRVLGPIGQSMLVLSGFFVGVAGNSWVWTRFDSSSWLVILCWFLLCLARVLAVKSVLESA